MVELSEIRYNNRPIILTLDYFIKYLDDTSLEKIVKKAFKISSLMTHYYNAYDYREDIFRDMEVHNIFKLINIYGYGVCKQFVLLMGALLDIFSIKHRILYLGNKSYDNLDHFAIEVYYEDSWHYYDPNLGVMFLKENRVVSCDEIVNNDYSTISDELSGEKWIKVNSALKKLEDKVLFKKKYLQMFSSIEELTLFDENFSYKKELLKKGYVKWYSLSANKYFFSDSVKIKKADKQTGVVSGNLDQSNDIIEFSCVSFTYEEFNEKKLSVNDFPLLLIDLKLIFNQDAASVNVFVNGKKYELKVKSGEALLGTIGSEIYKFPIHSVYLEADCCIQSYSINAQRSSFVDSVINYIEGDLK